MNLNSFQIRKISTLYALTGVRIECININRPGWASADKLSTISQREDWSYRARGAGVRPHLEMNCQHVGKYVFFLKWYLMLGPALVPSSTVSWYLTPAHQAALRSGSPGPPWKESDRPPSFMSLRMLFWLWKQSRLPPCSSGVPSSYDLLATGYNTAW